MIMKVQQLTKSYGDQVVFSGLTFEISKGEIISLVGPSGCGKSTLLRCLAGLSNSTSGKIELNGEDITSVTAENRPIVMMFQQPLLFPHLTIIQNVTYGLKYRKQKIKKKERVKRGLAILEKVELTEYAHRYPKELSGGQQQRISLARAMILNPSLLLLDEPFSNLDPTLRTSIRKWVRDFLKKEGVTGVFVTHDREEAMVMGDKIAVMKEGAFQQFGTPEDVYLNPSNASVAELFSEGIYYQGQFIAANNLTLVSPTKLIAADTERLPAVIEHKIMKYGYSFFQVNVPSLNQKVVIQSTNKLRENEVVYLCYKNMNIINGKKRNKSKRDSEYAPEGKVRKYFSS